MSLPQAVRRRVEARFGPIRTARPVGGGCVSPALRLEGDGGRLAFLKYDADAPSGFFSAEARGLERLRAAAEGLRVPQLLAVHEPADEGSPGEPAWLLLEWLEPARRGAGFAERLGRGLAALHRSTRAGDEEGWGGEEDGFIGPLPQSNAAAASWASFWQGRRLEPQLRRAREAGRQPGTAAEWERLFARLPELLAPAEAEGASLLHGDLWSGNVLAVAAPGGEGGEPALIDPAAYRGHREVDLAMSELFGGFGAGFYAAYREAWPLLPGYRERRRAVYQLYYLLVHVNLFGGGYAMQTLRVLREAGA